MWITTRELKRLERELSAAIQRAASAESRLNDERKRVDKLTVAVMDFGANKAGSTAISTRADPPPPPSPHPKGFTHEPDATDAAKLDYYIKCCRDVGRDESEAVAYWEAEMRGEHPAFLAVQDDNDHVF